MNSPSWCQANVAFPDWERAEIIALAQLVPLLRAAEDEGALTAWFIVRKHPCWRVRYLPAAADGQDRIRQGLDALIVEGYIKGWTEIIYEPEVHAFGGAGAMASAHRLFHRDSRSHRLSPERRRQTPTRDVPDAVQPYDALRCTGLV